MSQQKLEQAKKLMARGDYAKARALVANINDPSKKRWLAQIDKRIAQNRRRKRAVRRRTIALAVILTGIVLLGLGALLLRTKDIPITQAGVVPTLRILTGEPVSIPQTASATTVAITTVQNADNAPTEVISPRQPATEQPYLQVVNVLTDHPAAARQVLRLTEFDFEKTPSAIDSVILEVQNISDTPQSGVAWYLLSQPGNTQPWVNPVYKSAEQNIDNLAPGKTVTLTFLGVPRDFATGDYSLSTWVHRIDSVTRARTHQDGMGYSHPIFIASPLVLKMTDVAFSSSGGKTMISLSLGAQNNTRENAVVAFSFTVASSAPASEPGNIYEDPKQKMTLAAGESQTLPYTVKLPLPTGTYTLTGWLYRYENGTSTPVAGIPYETMIVVP